MLQIVSILSLLAALSANPVFAGNNFSSSESVAKTVLGAGVALKLNEGAALYENPAMLSESSMIAGQTYVGLGMTQFMIESKSYPNGLDETGYVSNNKGNTFPNLSIVHALNSKLKLGLGYYITTGGSADFEGIPEMGNSKIQSLISQAPLSATYDFAPELSMSFALNYVMGLYNTNNAGAEEITARDQSFAPSIGLRIAIPEGGRIGIHYFAGATVTYKEVTDLDTLLSAGDGKYDDVKFGAPAHMTFAYAHPVMDNLEATLEYQLISWSSTEHYKDLNWTDETILLLAGNYEINSAFSARLALGHVEGGMPEESGVDALGSASYQRKAVNRTVIQVLNSRAGGIFTNGYSFGFSYKATSWMTLNFGYGAWLQETRKQNSSTVTLQGPREFNRALQMTVSEAIFGLDLVI